MPELRSPRPAILSEFCVVGDIQTLFNLQIYFFLSNYKWIYFF